MPLRCLTSRVACADLRAVRRPMQTEAERREAWEKRTKAARAIYHTPEWRRARDAYLRANYACVACGKAANTVDHIKPHRGDPELFWDARNWQPMCFLCHQAKRGRERVMPTVWRGRGQKVYRS